MAAGRDVGSGLGAPMSWLGVGAAVVGLAGLIGLAYWHLILAEGAYLGPRVVAWTYDWVATRYDSIKRFNPRDESWFVAGPVLGFVRDLQEPLVLDVATGTGRVPLALFRAGFPGRVVGLDLSLKMLEQASAKLRPYAGSLLWVWQDATRLPFEDGTFDVVTCLESLEFLPRPRQALAEMVRVLAPGGILFVSNRVGREARLLPGRALPRRTFEQVLLKQGLCDLKVQRWQVSYDLAAARKPGQAAGSGGGRHNWCSWLRCPVCRGPVVAAAAAFVCPACGRSYAIREGIAEFARSSGKR